MSREDLDKARQAEEKGKSRARKLMDRPGAGQTAAVPVRNPELTSN
jgi:hypothetical protein